MSHAFWEWSLERYDQPGVASEAIQLQDEFGLNVNTCLWCVWLAEEGRDAAPLLDQAVQAIAPWSMGVTEAIREARRKAKNHPRADTLYKSILACELDAEHVEQDILFELAAHAQPASLPPLETARNALERYAEMAASPANFDPFLKTVFPTGK
ncbi:TIGR02444 family protein [Hyphobacterium sp.]|uniref:TIGR02444 family protein n=1 Tax=Hyphobacterium sp. TaxID=2004662 RepID=UPI003BA9BEAF